MDGHHTHGGDGLGAAPLVTGIIAIAGIVIMPTILAIIHVIFLILCITMPMAAFSMGSFIFLKLTNRMPRILSREPRHAVKGVYYADINSAYPKEMTGGKQRLIAVPESEWRRLNGKP